MTCNDFVTAGIPDFYELVLERNGRLSYSAAVENGSASVTVGVFAAADQILESNVLNEAAGTSVQRQVTLEKGTYYVRVSGAASALYELTIDADPYAAAEPDVEPGEGAEQAFATALTGNPLSFGGYVGATDDTDIYRLQLSEPGSLLVTFADPIGAVRGALYATSSLITPESSFSVGRAFGVNAGDYYFEVETTTAPGSLYTVVFTFTSLE